MMDLRRRMTEIVGPSTQKNDSWAPRMWGRVPLRGDECKIKISPPRVNREGIHTQNMEVEFYEVLFFIDFRLDPMKPGDPSEINQELLFSLRDKKNELLEMQEKAFENINTIVKQYFPNMTFEKTSQVCAYGLLHVKNAELEFPSKGYSSVHRMDFTIYSEEDERVIYKPEHDRYVLYLGDDSYYGDSLEEVFNHGVEDLKEQKQRIKRLIGDV